jgi:SPP1 family predicted phage head-tail adaptor
MGYMPSAIAITRARTVVAQSFDRTITLRRTTFIPDGSGGSTETTTETTYSGRVSARQVVPNERLQAGRMAAEMVWTVRLPHDADVEPADVLVLEDGTELQVTDRDDIKSTKLQVLLNCYRVT